MSDNRYLDIYLEDHYAGAVVGYELAKRSLSNNKSQEFADELRALLREIAEDKTTLQDIMHALEVAPDRLKSSGAWLGEKIGRLKLNGHVRSYSPLSRVEELDGLVIGVRGKWQLWKALAQVVGIYPALQRFDLDALVRRAEDQERRFVDLHARAVEIAFEGPVHGAP